MSANYRQTSRCCKWLNNKLVTTNIRADPLTSLWGCTLEWRRTDLREGGRAGRAGLVAAHEADPREPLSAGHSFSVVNLCALKLVGVIHIDGFPCCKEVECAKAFAVAVAGVLYAPERQVHLGADGGSVDIGDA